MALVYGIHAVEEALKADPGRIERICIQRGQSNPRVQQIIDLGREKHVILSFEDKSWLDRKAEGQRHQGVLCYVSEMPTLPVEALIEEAKTPGVIVVLDGIEDPHNLGAIVRSAEVSGADGIILPQRRAAGIGAAAVKSSAGAATHVRIARAGNTASAIELLKKAGYWISGLAGVSTPFGAPLIHFQGLAVYWKDDARKLGVLDLNALRFREGFIGIASPAAETTVTLLNPDTAEAALTATGHSAAGATLAGNTILIAAGARWTGTITDLLNSASGADLTHIRLVSDGDIYGFETISAADRIEMLPVMGRE